MAYAINVMVIDKKTNRGLSGQRVKLYGGTEMKTKSNGMTTLISESSSVTVYVNGFQVYSGGASSASNPIIYEKG